MRYKEFNRNSVLEKCLRLFWKGGFRACAISDIVESTGVNRFSLYEEFQNKEGILTATLKLYRTRYSDPKFEVFKEDLPVEEILSKFYLSFLDHDNIQDGCFIIHVGTELADTDQEVNIVLKSYLEDIESHFRELLERDKRYKDNSSSYAKNLVGLFCTSMSFCLIHSDTYRKKHIDNGINVILQKHTQYA